MKVLVIDIGGTHIKVASSDHPVPLKIVSGPTLTADRMVADVLGAAKGWQYDAITIGFPGPVVNDRPAAEPHNLGKGWVDFSYEHAFPKPVRFLNDAAMQALGGYSGGKMLFLGTGTGLGSAFIENGHLLSLELAHLPYKNGKTFEDYVGLAGLERRGKVRWRRAVADVVQRLRLAFVADYVLLGGGNAKLMKTLPEATILGQNSNAITGGIALWHQNEKQELTLPAFSRGSAGRQTPTKRANRMESNRSGKVNDEKSEKRRKKHGKG